MDQTTETATSAIPYGECQCGCGGKAPLAVKTNTARGDVKGRPVRFISGHQFRGHVESQKTKAIEDRTYTGPPILCGCGCGQPTPISKENRPGRGLRKGYPQRFIQGHVTRLRSAVWDPAIAEPAPPSDEPVLCGCGCGEVAPVAMKTRGAVRKGQQLQFVHGHSSRVRTGKYAKREIGQKYVDPNSGYVFVYMPDHPAAGSNGKVQEHRLVMEQVLGRYLTRQEVVHHLDGNRQHNAASNLQVISSISEHRRLHAQQDAPRGWTHKYDACIACGTTTTPHAGQGRCIKCYIRPDAKKRLKWARHHDACVNCGSTTMPHQGLGLCTTCYFKPRR